MSEPEPVIGHWWEAHLEFLDRKQRSRLRRALLDACREAGLAERQRRREEMARRRARERAERAS